jgi:hypothetical protein
LSAPASEENAIPVTVGAVIVKDLVFVTAAKLVSPDCAATNVHVPAFTIVTVSPETVQMGVVEEESETDRDEDAVGAGVIVNGVADHSLLAG